MGLDGQTLSAKIVFSIPFDNQDLETSFRIVTDSLKRVKGQERVEVTILPGYYRIKNTIEISNYNHVLEIKGDKKDKVIISGERILNGRIENKNGHIFFIPDSLFSARKPGLLAINGRTYLQENNPVLISIQNVETQQVGENECLYFVFVEPEKLKELCVSEDVCPIAVIIRKWVINRWEVVNIEEDLGRITVKGPKVPSYNPISIGSFLYFENVEKLLDQPYEWVSYNDGTISFVPGNDVPEHYSLGVPGINTLIRIKGESGHETRALSFNNIEFECAGMEDIYRFDDIEQASNGMSAALEIDNACEIRFDQCIFRNISNYGLWIRNNCNNITIVNSLFSDLGAGGIKIGVTGKKENDPELTSNISIINNRIENYGRFFMDAVGIIVFNAANNHILHNDISRGGYSAISLGWTWGYGFSPTRNNEVAYNRIHDIGNGLMSDMGGIYHLGDATGSFIHHNIISNVKSPFNNGWGIYADDGTSNILIENNIVTRCTSGGFHQHYGKNNVVRNNIFAYNEQQQVTITTTKENPSLFFYSNVLLSENGIFYSGVGIHSSSVKVADNCYWGPESKCNVSGIALNEWISLREPGSVFDDPKLRERSTGSFKVHNRKLSSRIHYKDIQTKGVGQARGLK